MTARADVEPRLLEWAAERSGKDPEDLANRFPRLDDWVNGDLRPTFRQLEHFGRATHTPVGYFFLKEPPHEQLPVPDFRTLPQGVSDRPSPNLLDTIYLCEQRQDWYRSFRIASQGGPLGFVGSAELGSDPAQTAAAIQETINFSLEVRRESVSWREAFSAFREHVEDAGILVMVSGVVGSNTHRKLEVEEFRGFALVDRTAPVIFVNGADTQAAQIFTLAHELAHVWLGQAAVSNLRLDAREVDGDVERWCNAVASELLVPLASLLNDFSPTASLPDELQRLARKYRVSTLVVLKRVFDAGFLPWDNFRAEWDRQINLASQVAGTPGGNFYNTQPVRVSKRFARAVVVDALEGGTLYDEAFRLLGIKKKATFDELAERLGIL
jgi:Zn-dependent peptidase ImmA (M78 family)